MDPSPRPSRDLLLATAFLAPLAPVAGLFLLPLLIILWARSRSPRRELVAVGLLLAVAATALGATVFLNLRAAVTPKSWRAAAEVDYRELWQGLRNLAGSAAERLGSPPAGPEQRLEAFRRLERLDKGTPDATLILVDPDGEPVAWAGQGLLHDLRAAELPSTGAAYRASFGSVSLLTVSPLGPGPRYWKVVAGRSLSTDRLPFGSWGPGWRWSLVGSPTEARSGALLLEAPEAPTMVVGAPSQALLSAPLADAAAKWIRLAWLSVGLALLVLAVMRGAGLMASGEEKVRGWLVAAMLLAMGTVAAGRAVGLPWLELVLVAAGLSVAGAGTLTRPGRKRARAAGAGLAAVVVVLGGAFFYQGWNGASALGVDLWEGPRHFGLELLGFLVAAGLLGLARGEAAPTTERGRGWAWGATIGLVLAAALHDSTGLASGLLLAGGVAAGSWVGRVPRRGEALAVACLLGALISSTGWQIAYRHQLRNEIRNRLLPALLPPRPAEMERMQRQLDEHFAALDLADILPRQVESLEDGDLAYTLWRRSPLARRDALTAVSVLPLGGLPISFAYGLPLAESGRIDLEANRWQRLRLPVWQGALIYGESELVNAGFAWGRVRYWLLPLPGFRLPAPPLTDPGAGLLRGGPVATGPAQGLPPPMRYGLYADDGRALLSPWEEAPPLPEQLRTEASARVSTPEGQAWGFAGRQVDGFEVIFLPVIRSWAAVERVATQAFGVLLVLAAAAFVGLLLALPRAAFRNILGQWLRSYSKRLLLAYSILLFLPLLLLNVVMRRTLESHLLEAQRADGEAALEAAQRVMGEYVLSLEPGFGLDTAVDDELLEWLSRAVQHEVNLYWGSSIYASSKRELFTAGILPERIPGEIYSRLATLGYDLSSRINQVGALRYLELYAPVRVPGLSGGDYRLFVSMPLLAQQEEAARQLALLTRHEVLVTAVLFLLAVGLGRNLARGFAEPIKQLVAGTQRIAAGATSLEMRPRDLEVAALVEAVDRMAGRIAEARRRLVHEKQVVDRIVQHVTSGIVSLDTHHRVLRVNRVAAELLGLEVDDDLDAVLGEDERWGSVLELVRGEPGPREATVHLPGEEGEGRELRLVWVPIPGSEEPAALLVVEDATEVLRAQRLQAWAEMARIIAHEIKNPLTPIRLSAEHMREVHRRDRDHFDEVFERCTANILRQVDELQQISQEFSTYSHIPRLEARPGDLVEEMRGVAEAYRSAPQRGIEVRFAARPEHIELRFDRRLLTRAVRNLMENALRASGAGGRVELAVDRDGDVARVRVTDSGPGVPVELLPRIFDPYFSTYDSGTGLGLPIARRIAEEHGGRIEARNRGEGGLEVTLFLPLG